MANGWNPLIGIGFTALGVGYLYEAFNGQPTPTPVGGQKALGYAGPTPPPKGEPLVVQDGVRSIKFYPAGNIGQRVGYILAQMRKDAASPEVISEATSLLSRKCPVDPRSGIKGLKWCIEPKDWKTEKLALFYYSLVDPNSKIALRYGRDPEKFDGFRSAALMRRIPFGDCDDFVIRLGALLMAVGYSVKARVVAPAGQPGAWAHIYLVASDEPGNPNPAKWYSLDPTEPQHGPFWEVPDRLISSKKDFAA
jgi:hypothetical protein